MNIENAREFDPNNRPLKGEWVLVTDGDTATMPSVQEHVDASLTQGHDVVVRQQARRAFPAWAIIVLVVAACAIGFGVFQLAQGGSNQTPVPSLAPNESVGGTNSSGDGLSGPNSSNDTSETNGNGTESRQAHTSPAKGEPNAESSASGATEPNRKENEDRGKGRGN